MSTDMQGSIPAAPGQQSQPAPPLGAGATSSTLGRTQVRHEIKEINDGEDEVLDGLDAEIMSIFADAQTLGEGSTADDGLHLDPYIVWDTSHGRDGTVANHVADAHAARVVAKQNREFGDLDEPDALLELEPRRA